MGAVQFRNIPAGNGVLVPGLYAEVDNSQGNSATPVQRALLIGQVISGALAPVNIATAVNDALDAKQQFGAGSQLARMAAAYRRNDPTGELWALPLADNGSGVLAAGTIAFTGPATAPGALSLYIAGDLVSVPVSTGDSATVVGAAVAAAINANTDLPVTAAASSGTVTLTANNKGTAGNDIDVQLNYRGRANNEVTPAGLAAVITALASGATNPVITTALTNLGDAPFDAIILGNNDATTIAAVTAFLSDTGGRWSYAAQVFGQWFAGFRSTYSAALTEAASLNDQHGAMMPANASPTWTPEWAAAWGAFALVSARADPGQAIRDVVLQGVLPPPKQSRYTWAQRNTLLANGMSTFKAVNGQVVVEKSVTTYQKNTQGQPDNSYRDLETMFLLMAIIRTMIALYSSRYGRVKLAGAGTRVVPGSGVVTPAAIRADLIAEFQTMQDAGWVQNAAAFVQTIVVQKDALNPDRVNFLWPGTLINRLDVLAGLIQFRNS